MDAFIYDKPEGVILSSQLSRITIVSSADQVGVSLYNSHGRVLFSENLCTFSGKLFVYELDKIIESSLRSEGASFDRFTLRAGEDRHVFNVLLCSAAPFSGDLSVWLTDNFLSTLNARRVAPNASLALFAFIAENDDASLTVSGHLKPLGKSDAPLFVNTVIDPKRSATYTGVWQFNIFVPDLAHALFKEADVSARDYKLIAFSVRCSQRSMDFFIDDTLLSADMFYFRNCFGVWDFLSIPGVSVAKSVSEIDLARVSDLLTAYNRVTAKSYESVLSPLSACEADWIDQFFSSEEVMYLSRNSNDISALVPIIISDSTCEISSNPEEPNSASFVWQYDTVRPVLFPPVLTRVFSPQFDSRFA